MIGGFCANNRLNAFGFSALFVVFDCICLRTVVISNTYCTEFSTVVHHDSPVPVLLLLSAPVQPVKSWAVPFQYNCSARHSCACAVSSPYTPVQPAKSCGTVYLFSTPAQHDRMAVRSEVSTESIRLLCSLSFCRLHLSIALALCLAYCSSIVSVSTACTLSH
jgi:hypothetical protein